MLEKKTLMHEKTSYFSPSYYKLGTNNPLILVALHNEKTQTQCMQSGHCIPFPQLRRLPQHSGVRRRQDSHGNLCWQAVLTLHCYHYAWYCAILSLPTLSNFEMLMRQYYN
jgi:hypothetical protein